ncbi:MAG: hypothetical protein HC892_17555 [Saprospiraceae bacterium]|nr:hypothetical protein [Saprospiraceae bacterium]
MSPIIECVPNFSEGKDLLALERIAAAIRAQSGVQLLHTDIGAAAHRTVMTFAGAHEAVVEAAFQAIMVASEVIDMRFHKGEHPRIGATDVCPLVPVQGISLSALVPSALQLAKRVGEELQIPVYLYEMAASKPERKRLADIRKGEYEQLAQKINHPAWIPDFGPKFLTPVLERQ